MDKEQYIKYIGNHTKVLFCDPKAEAYAVHPFWGNFEIVTLVDDIEQ